MKWCTSRILLVTVVALIGCHADASSPSLMSSHKGERVASTVEEDREQARLERLARAFALSLRDDGFRARIHRDFLASGEREGKLDLSRMLRSDGLTGLRALAAVEGSRADKLAEELALSVPREVYLPFAAHRDSWTGGSEVLVATALRDGDVPVAFDVEGRRLLLDPELPPTRPVIAIVPAETALSQSSDGRELQMQQACPPEDADLCEGGGGSGGGGGEDPPKTICAADQDGTKLLVCRSIIPDVGGYEGWLRGAPEVSIILFSVYDNGTG